MGSGRTAMADVPAALTATGATCAASPATEAVDARSAPAARARPGVLPVESHIVAGSLTATAVPCGSTKRTVPGAPATVRTVPPTPNEYERSWASEADWADVTSSTGRNPVGV